MQTTKYQIFVSSTHDDLKEPREQVIKAILEMGHIPVGMEMFSAADEEQWKIITRQIDQSDYYVVIIAHRYGSMVKGISYTEKEYNYAIKQEIPVLGFILDDKASWLPEFMEEDAQKKKLLKKFIQKAKRKPVNFWSTKEQLYAQVSIALSKAFNTNPRPGWIRATEVAGPEVANEISRLSRENVDLRKQVEEFNRERDISHLAQGEDISNLPYKIHNDTFYLQETWNDLFQYFGQAILQNHSFSQIRSYMIRLIKEHATHIERASNSNNHLSPAYQPDETIEKMKIQFISLGLIELKPIDGGGGQPSWVLTPRGNQVLADLLAIRRDISTSEKEDSNKPTAQ